MNRDSWVALVMSVINFTAMATGYKLRELNLLFLGWMVRCVVGKVWP